MQESRRRVFLNQRMVYYTDKNNGDKNNDDESNNSGRNTRIAWSPDNISFIWNGAKTTVTQYYIDKYGIQLVRLYFVLVSFYAAEFFTPEYYIPLTSYRMRTYQLSTLERREDGFHLSLPTRHLQRPGMPMIPN